MHETNFYFNYFSKINTHLLLLVDESLSSDINNYLFNMAQTFIQESGRLTKESCSKFYVIFLLSKNNKVTIITILFNICILSLTIYIIILQ